MKGHCEILIEVFDVNDNASEISISSLSVPISEGFPLGTVVALLSISDRDSGGNGQVSCSVWPPDLPFKLTSSFKNDYSLVLIGPPGCEKISEYIIVAVAQDEGNPLLSTISNLIVSISDINDNAPTFTQHDIAFMENNQLGVHIVKISALDPDMGESAQVSYWTDETHRSLSSYIFINSESSNF
ncbi:protocadherin alpha-3-like [Pantherophis guttatus]|uniref:Protocadherin alpha-3-like n=1 Tax=Pantherophis guttatus TaxID=94885 RepID=A0A6P9BH41_PANGU|nr:protocadherin alpha-3-like [Pantherophis guttatus]